MIEKVIEVGLPVDENLVIVRHRLQPDDVCGRKNGLPSLPVPMATNWKVSTSVICSIMSFRSKSNI